MTAPIPTPEGIAAWSKAQMKAKDFDGVILSWHDADTCKVEIDLRFDLTLRGTIRVLHVNAPELSTGAPGKAATDFAKAYAPEGTSVRVTTYKPSPKDKYGRWLADISVGETTLSGQLLQMGLAVPYEG